MAALFLIDQRCRQHRVKHNLADSIVAQNETFPCGNIQWQGSLLLCPRFQPCDFCLIACGKGGTIPQGYGAGLTLLVKSICPEYASIMFQPKADKTLTNGFNTTDKIIRANEKP